ncbi:hypothetical protein HMPREF9081_0288 [Centipeda periodontii DSM 2778]|uniref:GGDEF domain-containing protein n=1 Tax=Centipeda periodontii DSM 2778 TaxID=888060 RepID=F5RJ53_9FIRM|nr:hypothetical protein HMPREF9081_0288 [Centipeda periodontii DSM 2778]
MYHVQLKIAFIGIAEDKVALWKGIAPKEHFSHSFYTICKEEDLVRELADEEQLLVIMDRASFLSPSMVRKAMPARDSLLILCADDPDQLQTEDYEAVDDIWVNDGPALARFHFANVLTRISERKRAWLQETWLQATINTLPDMVWFKDLKGIHLDVNDAFCTAVAKEKADVRGRDHYDIWDIPKEVYEASDYVCVETEDEVLAARTTCLFDEEVMKADGNLSKLKTYKTPIFDGDTIIGTVGIARDVTKEYEYQQNIVYMALHDQLTGLANRRQLDEFLSKLETNEMVVAYLDLDHFKSVNDTYGHLAGDEALVRTSDLIKKHFHDTLNVRIGGDEFLIIFTDGVVGEDIPGRMQGFIDDFFESFKADKRFGVLSVSAGIAEGKVGHGSFDLLLQKADEALYEAKEAGRGRYVISHRDEHEVIR